MNKAKKLNSTQLRCLSLFQGIWLAYILATIGSLVFICYYNDLFLFPLGAGIVLGSIYFAVAGYTFYDLFLTTDQQSNRAGMVQVSFGRMLSWLMPVTVMVLFVCLCFMLIYDLPYNSEENRGIYFSHPYYLGTLYTEANSLRNKSLTDDATTNLIRKAHGLHFYASEKQANSTQESTISLQDKSEGLAHLHKIPFAIAFAFSFIGVLLFTLRDVVSRFKTKDLYPKTFIGYQIRFILAISLAVGIANYFMTNWPIHLAPLLFMGIGMFPNRALQILEKKGRSILNLEKEHRKILPLTLLQGMTNYYYERFQENNITDVQNLAQSDLVFLRKNMSCGSRILADFVAQAILIELFPAKNIREMLQIRGIRDVVSLRDTIVADDSTILSILDLNREELLALLHTGALRTRIDVLSTMKEKSDKRDKKQFVGEPAT
jgi:hypothetical protein